MVYRWATHRFNGALVTDGSNTTEYNLRILLDLAKNDIKIGENIFKMAI